jgi:hypothetical protein
LISHFDLSRECFLGFELREFDTVSG